MSDDYSSNTSTTGAVSVGSSSNGNIETAGDTDWFNITLVAGATYRFDLEGSATSHGTLANPFLRLRDGSGNSITYDDDSGTGLNSRISFAATAGGAYFLSVGSSTTSGTGTYRLSATQTAAPPTDDYSGSAATSGTVGIGGSANGSIETVGDTDWFKTTLVAGHTYQIDVEGSPTSQGTLADAYGSLRNSSGTKVAEANDGGTGNNTRFTYTVPSGHGGVYYVAAGSNNNGTGTYHVGLTDVTPTSTNNTPTAAGHDQTMAPGAVISLSTLFTYSDGDGPSDIVSFDVRDQTIGGGYLQHNGVAWLDGQLTPDQPIGTLSQWSYVVGPSGAIDTIGFNVTDSQGAFNPTVTAKVSATAAISNQPPVVSGSDHTYSTNQLHAVTEVFNANDPDGSVSTYNFYDSTPGAGYFTFDGAHISGSSISVSAANLSRIGYFTGSSAGTNDIACDVIDNQGGTSATKTITITVAAGTLPSDDYSADTSTTGVVSVGSLTTGTIGAAGDKDWFAVSLVGGHSYHFTGQGTSGSLDLVAMRLYNSVGLSTSSLADNSAPLDFTPTNSGTYYLATSAGGPGDSWKTKSGNYSLSVTDGGAPTSSTDTVRGDTGTTATLSAGTITGSIEQNDLSGDGVDRDYYRVVLTGGHRYTFTSDAAVSASDTLDSVFVRLRDAGGNILNSDRSGEGATASFAFDTPGGGSTIYYVAVSAGGLGFADKTGGYRLMLADNGVTGAGGDTVAGTISTTAILPVHGEIRGTIDQNDLDGDDVDGDLYRVTLAGGTSYLFKASAAINSNDTLDSISIQILDSQGRPLDNDKVSAGENPSFVFDTPGAGSQTYFISVKASSVGSSSGILAEDKTGQYSLDPEPRSQYSNSLYNSTLVVGGVVTFGFGQENGQAYWKDIAQDTNKPFIPTGKDHDKLTHPAVDIGGVAEGSAVHAFASGDIILSSSDPSLGNYIIVKSRGSEFSAVADGKDFYALYAHLDTALSSGHVQTNGIIGTVGTGGNEKGVPAGQGLLHFELRLFSPINGSPYPPYTDWYLPWSPPKGSGANIYLYGDLTDTELRDDPRHDGLGYINPLDFQIQSDSNPNNVFTSLSLILESAIRGSGGSLDVAVSTPRRYDISASPLDGLLRFVDNASGTIITTASGFAKLFVRSGELGSNVHVGGLDGSDIINDTVFFSGLDGRDVFNGTDAGKSIVAAGGAGRDVLIGGAQGDVLRGDLGNDNLSGLGGADILSGGLLSAPVAMTIQSTVLANDALIAVLNNSTSGTGTQSFLAPIDTGTFLLTNESRSEYAFATVSVDWAAATAQYFDGDAILIVPGGGKGEGSDTIDVAASDGGAFSMQSIDLDTLTAEAGVSVTVTGHTVSGTTVQQVFVLDSNQGLQSFGLNASFVDLLSVDFSGSSAIQFDKLVLTPVPTDDDILDGGDGTDTADYSDDTAGFVANLNSGTANGAAIGTDSLANIENLVGGSGADTLIGDDGDNIIVGGAGDDILTGGSATLNAAAAGSSQAQTVTLQPGPEGQDEWITSVYYGGGMDDDRLRVGGWGDSYHALIKVDLSAAGLPAHVDSAKLRLYDFSSNGGAPTDMYVDELQTAWDESYRWNDHSLAYTTIGQTAVPDLGWFEIDVTQAVNDWLADPSSNFGLQLRPVLNNDNFNFLVSSDATGGEAGFRPQLVLDLGSAAAGETDDDVLSGGGGNDALIGGAGDDTLDGGTGFDTAAFSGNRAQYLFQANGEGSIRVTGPDGSDTVSSVERYQFADVVLRLPTGADFNQDALGDILWRNDDGTIAVWQATSGGPFAPVAASYAGAGTDWRVAGTADFDGDGLSDILWRSGSGAVGIWQATSSGTFAPDAGSFVSVGTDWRVAGTGDFNGDGLSDILWRNDNGSVAVWQATSAGAFASVAASYAAVGLDWHVAGIGDFDGDGLSDILWRNDNGMIGVWQTTNTGSFASVGASFVDVGTDWRVAGTGDFDSDGRSDILWRNDDGTVGVWQATATGAFASVSASFAGVGTDWHVATTGDFNGDGLSDILWRNDDGALAEWLTTSGGSFIYDSATSGSAATDWHVMSNGNPVPLPRLTNDFNGDGRSDILWRNDNGTVAAWQASSNGAFTPVSSSHAGAGSDWHVAGTGDFTGDGHSDILWRNDNGTVAVWQATGTGAFASVAASVAGVGTDWHVAGTADFTGDGRSDILWRNDDGTIGVWQETSGGSFASISASFAGASADWHVAGTGDFDGDGRSDILWRNDNGTVAVWQATSGGGFASVATSYTGVGTDWHVAGTGDFNGDGRSDILWRNDNGTIGVWQATSSGSFASVANSFAGVGSDWHVAGIGDYNGDGRSDILWRNDSGVLAEWNSNSSGAFTPNPAALGSAGTDWQIQSPDQLFL